MPWYALHTASNWEKRAAQRLADAGVEIYLPTTSEKRRWMRKRRTVETPVFRGYVFARFDAQDIYRRRAVLAIPGVVRILGAGDPEPIPDDQIEAIRRMMLLPTVQLHAPQRPHVALPKGSEVRVIRGPLRGFTGTFVYEKGQGRLVVVVTMLGQGTSAEMAIEDVEPISSPQCLPKAA